MNHTFGSYWIGRFSLSAIVSMMAVAFGARAYGEVSELRLVPELAAKQIRFLASATTPAQVQREIEYFAAMGSRIPGYPGAEQAYQHVLNRFRRLELHDVRTDTFSVEVPVDAGMSDVVVSGTTGRRLHAWCLWPNGVRTPTTPPGGLVGSLIYGGGGTWAELDQKPVADSIVLLDFGSGQNWVNAASLNAKAILFFNNGNVSRAEAEQKFLSIPLDVPRFWIAEEAADLMLQRIAEEEAKGSRPNCRVEARMDWKTVPAYNVFGWLPGLDESMPAGSRKDPQKWKDQTLIVHAYYDAMSVVPALAPGAENAAGITALLQVAEVLARFRPDCTVIFLATSAHFSGMEGIDDFLFRHNRGSEHFLDLMTEGERIEFDLMLSLDLSSHGTSTTLVPGGTFYGMGLEDAAVTSLLPISGRLSRVAQQIFGDTLRHVVAESVLMPMASEAASFVGHKALAMVTVGDERSLVDTPLDTADRVDYESLAKQIQTLTGIVIWAAKDPDLLRPTGPELEDYGHSLVGTVNSLGDDEAATPVQDALVTYVQPGSESAFGVRRMIVERTDGDGRFRFDIMRNRRTNTIKAYKLNPETGAIAMAPDRGTQGGGRFSMEQPWGRRENEMNQVVFDSQVLQFIGAGHRLSVVDHVQVLNDDEGALPWGMDTIEENSVGSGGLSVAAVAYGPRRSRLRLSMRSGSANEPYQLRGGPEGWLQEPPPADVVSDSLLKTIESAGFSASRGTVRAADLEAVRDIWVSDEVRIRLLAEYDIQSEAFLAAHEQLRLLLLEAESHLQALRYGDYNAAVDKAWGLTDHNYQEIRSRSTQTIFSAFFYLAKKFGS
jgi:hypothetical protein